MQEAGRFRPDFPVVAGVWEGADCRFVLLQASGPALLPEAAPVTGIDFGLGSSSVLCTAERRLVPRLNMSLF